VRGAVHAASAACAGRGCALVRGLALRSRRLRWQGRHLGLDCESIEG